MLNVRGVGRRRRLRGYEATSATDGDAPEDRRRCVRDLSMSDGRPEQGADNGYAPEEGGVKANEATAGPKHVQDKLLTQGRQRSK